MPIRLLIADDHDSVRVGVKTTIDANGVGDVVGEADGTDALMHLLATVPSDVLVTDLSMPGGRQPDGYVLIELIRRRYPVLPIVVLSMSRNLVTLRMLLKLGRVGLIDKNSSLKELPQAVRFVLDGRAYVSARLEKQLADAEVEDGGLAGKDLTVRESEVLRLIASGERVSDIAKILNRSITTISKQKNSAMQRLGLDNNVELLDFLKRSGFR